MMKLFELIRLLYQIYKTLLNSFKNDRFEQLFSTTLMYMKSVLSLIYTQDLSKHLEETHCYLK